MITKKNYWFLSFCHTFFSNPRICKIIMDENSFSGQEISESSDKWKFSDFHLTEINFPSCVMSEIGKYGKPLNNKLANEFMKLCLSRWLFLGSLLFTSYISFAFTYLCRPWTERALSGGILPHLTSIWFDHCSIVLWVFHLPWTAYCFYSTYRFRTVSIESTILFGASIAFGTLFIILLTTLSLVLPWIKITHF